MPNNELGDFQTPEPLVKMCLEKVMSPNQRYRILEPTCGKGNFLKIARDISKGNEQKGIEIQADYVIQAQEHGEITQSSIFNVHLSQNIKWKTNFPLLIVGNPPWVTSADLKHMGSENLPNKENFKNLKGLDALLGSSNFDVCEYIILKTLTEISEESFTMGMLCKTQVARNIIEYAHSINLSVSSSSIYRINSTKWFKASVDACWFVISVDKKVEPSYITKIYNSLEDKEPISSFGVINNRMISDVVKYTKLQKVDGHSPYEWRSGLKHDASKIFELKHSPLLVNSSGVEINIEEEYVFPLLKSTDLFRSRHESTVKRVIIPQSYLGEPTDRLKVEAPLLWKYLNTHAEALDNRQSSIYKNRPRFSVFGHGSYTYAPYKVAISGFHKRPVFQLLLPFEGKPVVLDDTCYFIPFENFEEALVCWALLSGDESVEFLESIVFWDSKRPITKKVLSRISIFDLPVSKKNICDVVQEKAKLLSLNIDVIKVQEYIDRLGA